RVALGQAFVYFSGLLNAQSPADLPDDLVPDRQELACFSAELLPPELGAILSFNQVNLHGQSVARLVYFAGEQRTYAKVLSHLGRVDCFAFVGECRGARNHSDLWDLGQAVDELLGQTIAQVFGVHIRTG